MSSDPRHDDVGTVFSRPVCFRPLSPALTEESRSDVICSASLWSSPLSPTVDGVLQMVLHRELRLSLAKPDHFPPFDGGQEEFLMSGESFNFVSLAMVMCSTHEMRSNF